MTTNPIAGNQYFTGVDNNADQSRRVNAAHSAVANLQAGGAIVNRLFNSGGLNTYNGKVLRSIVGYAPTAFLNAGAGGSYFLNNVAGAADQVAPASTNTTVLVIPAGAIIVGASIQDATLAGGTVNLGTQAVAGAVAATQSNICAATTATVARNALVGSPIPALGAAATAPPSIAVAASPTVTGVTVTTSANMTATSGFQVIISYLI